MPVQANERYIWFDLWGSPRDESIEAYRAFKGCWFLVRGDEMIGPYQDESILRAYRMAGTLCINGCELGPGMPGWFVLGQARALRRHPKWTRLEEDELPPSLTHYEPCGLEPVGGCCTTFDSWPRLVPGPPLWSDFTDQEPELWGYLKQSWNAHPAGSLVLTQDPMELGMSIIDLAISP